MIQEKCTKNHLSFWKERPRNKHNVFGMFKLSKRKGGLNNVSNYRR